jgi:hypothetical protein
MMSAMKALMDKSSTTCLTEFRRIAIGMLTLGTLHPTLPRLTGHICLNHLATIVGLQHLTFKRWHQLHSLTKRRALARFVARLQLV